MSTRPSRSSSIPIPRSPATSSARNIESLLSIPFPSRQSTSPSTSRQIPDPRRVTGRDVSRSSFSVSHGASTVSSMRSISVPDRSSSHSFEPRIIRGSTGEGDSECPPNPSSSTVHPRRPTASIRTATSHRPIIPQHIVSRTAPVPFHRPTYLDHSSLRDLLHTEMDSHYIPSRRIDPTSAGSRNQAFAHTVTTPSETEGDPPYSSVSPPVSPLESFKLPTRWSEDRHPGLNLSVEGRELNLHGVLPNGEKEAAAARTRNHIPPACGIFYYEVDILGKEPKSRISIGFAGAATRLSKLPGTEPDSWAYYGDDGSAMSQEKINTQFSQSFGTGDTVGCGVDFTNYKAFFTKNGTLIGQFFDNIGRNVPIYPSIGLQHTGDSIRANFGQDPFKYDIEYHVQQKQNDVWNKILRTPLLRKILQGYSKFGEGPTSFITEKKSDRFSLTEEESKHTLNELLMSYLIHHGHIKTARAFKKQPRRPDEGDPVSENIDGSDDIELRTNIVNFVQTGNIDEAMGLLRSNYPVALEANNQLIFFKLRFRKFVELILWTTELKKKMKVLKGQEEGQSKPDPPQDSWMTDEMGMDIDDDAGPLVTEPIVTANSSSSQYGHDKYFNPELNQINAQYEEALNTAITYGQALSNDYHSQSRPELEQLYHKTFGIVAWEDPSEEGSGVADVVGDQSRTVLAHEVNEAILKSQGRPARPPLETLYRHTATCITQLGMLGVGTAAFADMGRELLQ